MSSPSERPHEQKGTGWQAACTSVALNAALMTMQIAVGLLAHSDGLLADGVHTLADLAADGMVLAVLHIGAIARARHHNPRYDGAEAVASLFIGALLLATGGEMLWQGVGATAGVTDVPSVHAGALVVAIFVILAKEGLFRYMACARRCGVGACRDDRDYRQHGGLCNAGSRRRGGDRRDDPADGMERLPRCGERLGRSRAGKGRGTVRRVSHR